jgi:lysine 6-dehydrogenase
MRVAILGVGGMGRAAAWDLARTPDVRSILLADADQDRAREAARALKGPEIRTMRLDLADEDAVAKALADVDGALTAADYSLNLGITRAAIRAGKHLVDLGGNMTVVDSQLALHEQAKAAGSTIVPNSGLAPGMANVLAAGLAARLDKVDSLEIRVGGLPLDRPPPLGYRLLFSVRGLTNEYLEPAEVLRKGRRKTVESLTEVESLEFPEPFGTLEAFHTSGGASLLPKLFEGKIQKLDYKTIRYPGHVAIVRAMFELGLFDGETRAVTEAALVRTLGGPPKPDAALVRVTAKGTKGGVKKTFEQELVEYGDGATGHSAMMRTTSYPAAAVLEMILTGGIKERGVLAQEVAVPHMAFGALLARRGLGIALREG